MKQEDKIRIEKYTAAMNPIISMYKKGIIDEKDYEKAEAFIAEKYCIKLGNTYRLNELIYDLNRANIVTENKG